VLTEDSDWLGGQLTSQAVPPDEHPGSRTAAARAVTASCATAFATITGATTHSTTTPAPRRCHRAPASRRHCHATAVMAQAVIRMLAPIEQRRGAGVVVEWVVAPVIVANAVAQLAVTARAAAVLDPGCSSGGTAWLVSWPPSQSESSVSTTRRPRRSAASAAATPPRPPPRRGSLCRRTQ